MRYNACLEHTQSCRFNPQPQGKSPKPFDGHLHAMPLRDPAPLLPFLKDMKRQASDLSTRGTPTKRARIITDEDVIAHCRAEEGTGETARLL